VQNPHCRGAAAAAQRWAVFRARRPVWTARVAAGCAPW